MKRKISNGRKRSFNVRLAITVTGLLFLALSCKELPTGQIPTDSDAPAPVTNVKIVPTYGGANVTYTLPKEDDISYVKCEFDYNGKHRVVRSSIYKNQLIVDGLGVPEEIMLKISVVDHSENVSQPHIENFTPLDPPMTAVLQSFRLEPAFGGVKITWENPAREMVGISFLAANDDGELDLKDMVFTSLPAGSKSLRGFNTDKRTFALTLSDKYENTSDTVYFREISPLYEVMLDKKLFSGIQLLGDNISVSNGRPLQNIWDGSNAVIWHTLADAGYTVPQYFTVNLGVDAQLTRFVLNNRDDYLYGQHNPRVFTVWATDRLDLDTHPVTDSYYGDNSWKADWHVLAECEVLKPSGSPAGTNTPEDEAAHRAGFEFEFTQDVSKMHYLRFEVHETWWRTPALHISEITVFGDER
ncbi:MAG: DUF5126 domain-containing protein [Tannerella sp.]|jgi:hypothetical protein|nr:DUF5126 domain-containing protein [Tannerella sp.]